jgi:hypothetical protein
MWFTGRFSGAATVLVLDPSQVTGLLDEPGAFGAEVFAEASAAGLVVPAVGLAFGEVGAVPELELEDEAPDEEAPEEEFAVGVVIPAAPSLWTPVPSSHAVRESAARTTVAAAPTRRVREVRKLDMWPCPFGVRVRW